MAKNVVMTASTNACFRDFFVEKYPQLDALRLLAEFCRNGTDPKDTVNLSAKADLQMVQAWQREADTPGEGYMPTGELMIRVRCFLSLADYEVTEVRSLEGYIQKLAMALGLGAMPFKEAAKRIWPTSEEPVKNLGRVLAGSGGLTAAAKQEADAIVAENRRAVERGARSWRERIRTVTGAVTQQSAPTAPSSTQDDVMLTIATGFGRSLATCLALGIPLVESGRIQDVRNATGGGQQLYEMAELLRRLSGESE